MAGLLPPVVAEMLMDIHEFKAGAGEAKGEMKGLAASGSAMFTKIGAGTAIAMVGIGVASIKMASDFEAQMTRLSTAAGAPKDAVKAATGQVLAMGDAVGFSGTQMAEALYHPVSAGLDLATSLEAVKQSAIEAQISGADLDDTTYALSSVMKAFNQDASQAHDTMALLNAIVGQGDMRFQDFNVSVKNWAPTAAQMGISIQSMGAALAYLTDRGNSAEEAATRVTMGLTMMAYPTKKAQNLLSGLGVSSDEVTAATTQMQEVLKKSGVTQNQLAADLQKPDGIYVALNHLKTALNDAGVKGQEADSVMSKIFGGGRSDKAILSLMQNLEGLRTKFDDITGGVQRYDQSWADTQQTFAFKMKKLGAELENVAIVIGMKLIPVVEAVAGWFEHNKWAAESLAGVIGGVLVVSLFKFAQTVTTTALTAVEKLIGSFSASAAAATKAAQAEEGAAANATAWAGTLGKAIPIIGGVVVGAVALGKWLGSVGDHAHDAQAAVTGFTSSIIDLSRNVPGAGDGMNSLARSAVGFQKSFGGGATLMHDLDDALASQVSSGHANQAATAMDGMARSVQAGGGSVADLLALLPEYSRALANAANAEKQAAVGATETTPAMLGTKAAAQAASDVLDSLSGSLKRADAAYKALTDTLTASGTLHAFQRDLLSVNDEIKANGRAFNESSIKGIANMEAFRNAATEIVAYRDQSIKSGEVLPAVANATAKAQTDALLKTWEKLTGNKKAVDDYAASLHLIPSAITTALTLTQNGLDSALSKLDLINAKKSQAGQPITIAGSTVKAGFASGGWMVGPGTSTSDKIQAWVSPREFMVSAAGASKAPPGTLEAINAGNPRAAGAIMNSAYGGGQQPSGVPVIQIVLDGQVISGAMRRQTLRYEGRNGNNNLSLNGRGFQ